MLSLWKAATAPRREMTSIPTALSQSHWTGKAGPRPYLHFRERCEGRFQDRLDWAASHLPYPMFNLINVWGVLLFPTYRKGKCNVNKGPTCFGKGGKCFCISCIFGKLWKPKVIHLPRLGGGFIQASQVLSGSESSNFAASVIATNCLVCFSELVCFSCLPNSPFCITHSVPSLQQNSIFMSF